MWNVVVVMLFIVGSAGVANANGGGYHYGIANQGEAKLFEPTNLEFVEMRSEKLDIDLYYRFARVRIEYLLVNTGTSPVTIEAGFPCQAYSDPVWWNSGLADSNDGIEGLTVASSILQDVDGEEGPDADTREGSPESRMEILRSPVLKDFRLTADDEKIPVTYFADASASAGIVPRELKSAFTESDAGTFENEYGMRLCWYTFRLGFAPGQKRKLAVSYDAAYFGEVRDVSDDSIYSTPMFTYLFSPAAAWKGPIGNGRVTIRAVNTDPDLVSFNLPKRFSRAGKDWTWTFRNFEPGFADDLRLIIRPRTMVLLRDEQQAVPGREFEWSGKDEARVNIVQFGEDWYIYNNKYKVEATSALKPQTDAVTEQDQMIDGSAGDGKTMLRRYDPENLRQWYPHTAWAEGVPGDGIGEALTLTLDKPAPVSGIAIYNGYVKTRELYLKNNRVAEFKVTIDDRPPFLLPLGDEYIADEPRYLKFPVAPGKAVKKIRLEITKVHRGSACRDTVISMLQVVTPLKHKLELSHSR